MKTEANEIKDIAGSVMLTCKCTLCGKTFEDLDALEIHIENIHDFKESVQSYCEFCKEYIKSDLKSHKINCKKIPETMKKEVFVKTDQDIDCKPNPGLKQEDNFQNKIVLKIDVDHKEEITNGKFKCEVCSIEFIKKSSLDIHFKVDHENIQEFKCHVCPKGFGSKENLTRHVNRIHLAKNEECKICGKELHGKRVLKEHIDAVHSAVRRHVCHICNKDFVKPKNLRVHVKVVHHKIRDFQCDICKKTFSVACNLKVHVQNVHKEVKDVFCDKCDSSFKSNLLLKHHVKKVHMKKSYECETCNKMFSTKSEVSSHIEVSHMEKEFKCNYCERRFKSPTGLRVHVKIVHKNNVLCKFCNKICSDNEEMKNHEKSHQGEMCSLCNEKFISVESRRRHVRIAHKDFVACSVCNQIIPYDRFKIHQLSHGEVKCRICYNTYLDNERLKIHLQKHQVEDLNCKYCGKCFKSVKGAKDHVKYLHENYLKCKMCNQIFSDIDVLRIHQTKCNKEVKCSFCDKNYKSLSGLRQHRKVTHEKYVKCTYCEKLFANNELMETHKKEFHSKGTKCPLCKKEFKFYKNLQIHIRKIHDKFTCSKCEKVFSENDQLKDHLQTHVNLK